jgi:transcriptional regulator GlxA family with amidase domain
MKIRIIGFDGLDGIDLMSPFEVLRFAARLHKDMDVKLVTLKPAQEIVTQLGMRVRTEGVLEDKADLVVVPGGGWVTRSNIGIRQAIEEGEIQKRIVALHKQGTIIASVCTGALALGSAGLLTGREATTHHRALDDLRTMGAKVLTDRVIDGGDVLSCGGVTTSLDLSLWLVERFFGVATAEATADYIEHPRSANIHISKK